MTEEQELIETKPESPTQPEPTPDATDTPSEPSFARRAGRWIFRLLGVVLFGMALGAGMYYGARRFYRDAIEPLQTLDQRVLDMETSKSELSAVVRENRNTAAEAIADLEGSLAFQTEDLAAIEAQVSRLELQIESQDQALEEIVILREALGEIEQDLEITVDQIDALEQLIQAGELPAERVERKLQLVRVMNLMVRTRLWIEQANYGLANEDIAAALEIMDSLSAEDEAKDEEIDEQLIEITERLILALETTRTNPAVAEEELEIIWKLLVDVTAP